MRAHVIEDNTVVNTIEVESLDFAPGLVEGSTGGIGWTLTDGTLTPPTEPELSEEAKAANARDTRDAKLGLSDWMVIRASEGGAAVTSDWATYRQDLRDVPEQAGFPNTITWPTEPT